MIISISDKFVFVEIIETLKGRNPHVSGKVAVLGLVAGIAAFVIPTLLISAYVEPSIAYAGAATDISLVNGLSSQLSGDARMFLVTQAVADDLAGLTVIITNSGLHENIPYWAVVICLIGSLLMFINGYRKGKVRWLVLSGVASTVGFWGIGIEPLLGMAPQAIFVGLVENNKSFRTGAKNIAGIGATGGLFLFIISHLSFTHFELSTTQMYFNLAMVFGKFIPTFPLMLGAGVKPKHAVLGSLMAATSGTVGLIFLEVAHKQGQLTPEMEVVGTTGIIVSIATCLVWFLVSLFFRDKKEKIPTH